MYFGLNRLFPHWSHLPSMFRQFHSTPVFQTRSWNRRRNGGRRKGGGYNGNVASKILLDKFVKYLAIDGSLIIRSPFNVKVRGSYFDKNNNVDRNKNKLVYDEIYNQTLAEEDEGENESCSSEETTLVEEKFSEENEKVNTEYLEAEKGILNQLSQTLETFSNNPKFKDSIRKSPLHALLYGRPHHRVDSYSIIDPVSKLEHTHVYITDANSFDEAESMLVQQIQTLDGDQFMSESDAHFTLWEPRNVVYPKDIKGKKLKTLQASNPPKGTEEESMSSGIKLFCPPHILEAPNPGIKTVFLTPTLMNKIYLQGDRSSHLELDASLIHRLRTVGMTTDFGNIRVRDLIADEIRLASRLGDIICEGSLEGHSVIEIKHDGDFLASYVDGPSVLVTTEDGDVNVWGDVMADVSQFYCSNGNIHVRFLYNQSYMSVRNTGSITTNLVQGFLTAIVKKGTINLTVDKLTADSAIQVDDGEITVSVKKSRNFRIQATAPKTSINPKLLNQGELFVDDIMSTFSSEPNVTTSNHIPFPILKIEASVGLVNLFLLPEDGDELESLYKSNSACT